MTTKHSLPETLKRSHFPARLKESSNRWQESAATQPKLFQRPCLQPELYFLHHSRQPQCRKTTVRRTFQQQHIMLSGSDCWYCITRFRTASRGSCAPYPAVSPEYPVNLHRAFRPESLASTRSCLPARTVLRQHLPRLFHQRQQPLQLAAGHNRSADGLSGTLSCPAGRNRQRPAVCRGGFDSSRVLMTRGPCSVEGHRLNSRGTEFTGKVLPVEQQPFASALRRASRLILP